MKNRKDVTIYDIAAAVNLSAATVSRALVNHSAIRKERKERVVQTAGSMDYRAIQFARDLRNRQ